MKLPIADCRLPIGESLSRRSFARALQIQSAIGNRQSSMPL